MNRFVSHVSRVAPNVIGSKAAFLVLLALTFVWISLGPAFRFSDSWLLVPSAMASIAALVLVVLLQYSQNRDTKALQLKLDEVIRAVAEARTELLRVEHRSDEELAQIGTEFDRLSEGSP